MATNGLTNGIASLTVNESTKSNARIGLGDVTHNNIKQLQLLIKTVGEFPKDEAWWNRIVEQCENAKEGTEPIKLGTCGVNN